MSKNVAKNSCQNMLPKNMFPKICCQKMLSKNVAKKFVAKKYVKKYAAKKYVAKNVAENMLPKICYQKICRQKYVNMLPKNMLSKIPNVKSVQSIGENQWRLSAGLKDDIRKDIFQFAVQNNKTLLEMKKEIYSVEDVFQQLTK